jgi:hypothetical protein
MTIQVSNAGASPNSEAPRVLTLLFSRLPRPSFRTQQADFFFRVRSCERVGLRMSEISLRFAFISQKSERVPLTTAL